MTFTLTYRHAASRMILMRLEGGPPVIPARHDVVVLTSARGAEHHGAVLAVEWRYTLPPPGDLQLDVQVLLDFPPADDLLDEPVAVSALP